LKKSKALERLFQMGEEAHELIDSEDFLFLGNTSNFSQFEVKLVNGISKLIVHIVVIPIKDTGEVFEFLIEVTARRVLLNQEFHIL
jgi:hypothetical protein